MHVHSHTQLFGNTETNKQTSKQTNNNNKITQIQIQTVILVSDLFFSLSHSDQLIQPSFILYLQQTINMTQSVLQTNR